MTTENATTLRPGLLVSLHTRLMGGVRYDRENLDADKSGERKVESWKTTKVTEDVDEYERAAKTRSKCGSLIRSVCTQSAFGLLCPVDKEKLLNDAIGEARKLADAFNATAKLCRIYVYVLKGRIAESDTEAARAIASEMRELLDEMRDGVTEGDVKRIREAATRAKQVGRMIGDPSQDKKVSAAIEEARTIARTLVKRVGEGGEDKAAVIQSIKLDALDGANFRFLDMDEPAPAGEAGEGGAPMPTSTPRALDTDEPEQASLPLPMTQAKLDLDEDDSEQADRRAASPVAARTLDC